MLTCFAEIVPSPLASSATTQSSLLSDDQRAAAKSILTTLDQEASNAQRASHRLQRTLSDVQKLLRPDELTR